MCSCVPWTLAAELTAAALARRRGAPVIACELAELAAKQSRRFTGTPGPNARSRKAGTRKDGLVLSKIICAPVGARAGLCPLATQLTAVVDGSVMSVAPALPGPGGLSQVAGGRDRPIQYRTSCSTRMTTPTTGMPSHGPRSTSKIMATPPKPDTKWSQLRVLLICWRRRN